MKDLFRRFGLLAFSAGGIGAAVLLALNHTGQVLASGPLFYCSDRALKERIVPANAQQVLTDLVKP